METPNIALDKNKVAVLVTGSRDWDDPKVVWDLIEESGASLVIHGDCPTGADADAADYCEEDYDVTVIAMPAQWHKHGRRAGPMRNEEMVKLLKALQNCGWVVGVLAFPKGRSVGTRGCIMTAVAYDLPIHTTEG